jgi:hypothetical protein
MATIQQRRRRPALDSRDTVQEIGSDFQQRRRHTCNCDNPCAHGEKVLFYKFCNVNFVNFPILKVYIKNLKFLCVHIAN